MIPYGVAEIGENAFKEKRNINSVVIPGSIKVVSGFADCINLKRVVLGEGLEEIAVQAFARCRNLELIIMPESLHTIGEYAFGFCTGLNVVYFPKSLKIIDDEAFAKCKNLKEVGGADNLEYVGADILQDTLWLEEQIKTQEFVILDNILLKGNDFEGRVVIPEGVTGIARNVFCGNTKIT